MAKRCICFFLTVTIFMAGCKQGVTYLSNEGEYSEVAKKCLDVMNLQAEAARKGVEIVSKYIDLDGEQSRCLGNDGVEFDFIGSILPSDLSLLKRTRSISGGNRTVGTYEEVSLEDELEEVVEEFKISMTSLIPDPTDALSLDYVVANENGIKISDDVEIPYNSIEGIVTVELLNSVANGKDLQLLIKELEDGVVINKNVDRALWYTSSVSKWANGRVNYRWGNVSENHKKEMLKAMSIWNDKTDGKVWFNEYENSGWNNFQLGIFAVGCITISDESTSDWNGLATVGYARGALGYLKLRENISGTELVRTCLHELGHTLGLMHEHQRYDRDSYINITNSDSNYNRIEKDIGGWRWASYDIRIGWWTVTVWYPCWWTQVNSEVYGDFDFNSIMLYSGIEIKSPYNTSKNGYNVSGRYYTYYNMELSSNDVNMIKNKYN